MNGNSLNLDGIRHTLIRQEDSIIFALLERSKYYYNVDTYKQDLFKIAGFGGSLVEYMVRETEKLHAKMGRYNSPDEHPFFPDDLPQPIVPRMDYPTSKALHPVVRISVTFVDKDGDETVIRVPIGMSMLEAAHENDIELEGACEGSLACSTCHVIVMDVEHYNKLEEPTDEENDMLDLAFGLTETSRLGCQVIASPELDGLRLALPSATRNFAVDGHVPKPH